MNTAKKRKVENFLGLILRQQTSNKSIARISRLFDVTNGPKIFIPLFKLISGSSKKLLKLDDNKSEEKYKDDHDSIITKIIDDFDEQKIQHKHLTDLHLYEQIKTALENHEYEFDFTRELRDNFKFIIFSKIKTGSQILYDQKSYYHIKIRLTSSFYYEIKLNEYANSKETLTIPEINIGNLYTNPDRTFLCYFDEEIDKELLKKTYKIDFEIDNRNDLYQNSSTVVSGGSFANSNRRILKKY